MIPRLEISFTLNQQWQFLFGKPYQPEANEFLLNHCRSGIMLALRALKLPQGSKVGMMVYNCHTVMNAIAEAGCVPVFIDVTDNLTIDIDDLKRRCNGLQALVVTHLFGIENDIAAIRHLFPNLPVIEDCAHAGGKEHAEGDFAVYSIGQGKLPSLGDGGILVVNNSHYLSAVEQEYESVPEYSALATMKLFCRMLFKSWLYLPLVYKCFTLPLKLHRGEASAREHIVLKRMCNGVSAMYNSVIVNIPAMIERRRVNAMKLQEQLSVMPSMESTLLGANAFMLVAACGDTAALHVVLQSKGIDSATHFAGALRWAACFGYSQGSCPNAETLIDKLLMIPTYKSK